MSEAIGTSTLCVRISNRQYAALRIFTDRGPGFVLTLDQAINVDQRSLGSLFHQKWIAYTRGGLTITREGVEAKYRFENTVVMRDTPSKGFSHYMHNVKTLMYYTATIQGKKKTGQTTNESTRTSTTHSPKPAADRLTVRQQYAANRGAINE